MKRRRNPPHVHEYQNQHGMLVYYLRRPGRKKVLAESAGAKMRTGIGSLSNPVSQNDDQPIENTGVGK